MAGRADPSFGEAQLYGFFEVGEAWRMPKMGRNAKKNPAASGNELVFHGRVQTL
jgi:hypothetical protein